VKTSELSPRVLANRRNAASSTGPRTSEGKAVAARNSLRHGLTAEAVILPNENAEDFDAFVDDLRAALDPMGGVEELMAERIVGAAWRLRRILRVEAAVYSDRGKDHFSFGKEPAPLAWEKVFVFDTFDKISRYEAALQRSLTTALHEIQRLQAVRAGREVSAPVVVNVDVVTI
jgi:hypothetical protein